MLSTRTIGLPVLQNGQALEGVAAHSPLYNVEQNMPPELHLSQGQINRLLREVRFVCACMLYVSCSTEKLLRTVLCIYILCPLYMV